MLLRHHYCIFIMVYLPSPKVNAIKQHANHRYNIRDRYATLKVDTPTTSFIYVVAVSPKI